MGSPKRSRSPGSGPRIDTTDAGYAVRMWSAVLRYLVTLPERSLRAASALGGGGVHEGALLLLPRFVRRSRLYEVTATNALRIATELIGGAERAVDAPHAPAVGRIAVQKATGNLVEVGSIAAFGFSPLWLLAAASDVLNGTRAYLRVLEQELRLTGVLTMDAEFASVEQLLAALEGTASGGARLIDLPPLELAELRRTLDELRSDATALPTPADLARLFEGLRAAASAEGRSLLEVSSGVGLAFLTSARRVGREEVIVPWREDWKPLHTEGFAAYASRVARPYGEAALRQFDPQRKTLTERLPTYARAGWGWLRARVPGPKT